MNKLKCAIMAAGVAVGLAFAGGVTAAPVSPLAATAPAAVLDGGVYNLANPVALEQTQWIYGGRQYCFYFNGWHGAGYYWCGYQFRRGVGWGGPQGWRGWNHYHHYGPGWYGRGYWNGGRWHHGYPRHYNGHNGHWNGHGRPPQ